MRQGPSAVLRGDVLDIEAQMGIQEDRPKFMDEYFQKTEGIKKSIAGIGLLIEGVKEQKKAANLATTPEMEKESSLALQKSLDEANRLVLLTKKQLEVLKEENGVFSASKPNSSEARIRDNLHQALTRKFRDTLLEYQTVQTEYKKEVKEKVTRQVKIVCPEVTEAEMEQIVESGEVTELIRARITGVQAHTSLQNALSDLQDKYRDIRRLEKNVSELHQLFVDLATLVDAQGELLDQIEYSVNSAKDYTEKAEKELVTARRHQKSAQKRMCWLSVCLVVLAVIVCIPLIVVFTK
eukprot:Lankesteria_metandrocarpae@DN1495_c0_g1_i1.p1